MKAGSPSFARSVRKWHKWCQTHRDLQQTPVQDSHCCWSQDSEFWHGWERRKSDVNAADWWRTVKLPFVKEKQEASCERPSPSGWEETAGRKPHLQTSERPSRGLHSLLTMFRSSHLAFWPDRAPPPSVQYHYFSHMFQSYQKGLCCWPSLRYCPLSRTTVGLTLAAAHPFTGVSKSCVFEEDFLWFTAWYNRLSSFLLLSLSSFFFLSSSSGDCMKPELQKQFNHLFYESL